MDDLVVDAHLVNELATKARQADTPARRERLMSELLDHLRPIITSVARKQIRRSGGRINAMLLDDMVGEGLAILVECLANYDGTKDFGAYVVKSYQHRVFSCYHSNTQQLSLSGAALRVARQASATVGTLSAANGVSPTLDDVAADVLAANRRHVLGVSGELDAAQIAEADVKLKKRGVLAAIEQLPQLLNATAAAGDIDSMQLAGTPSAARSNVMRLVDGLGPTGLAALEALWGLSGDGRKGRRAAGADSGLSSAEVMQVAERVRRRAQNPVVHYALFNSRFDRGDWIAPATPAHLARLSGLAPVS